MQLFTEKGFTTDHWKSVFPEIQVEFVEEMNIDSDKTATPNELTWIVTQTPGWQNRITHFVKQGNKVIALTRKADLNEFKDAFSSGATGYLDALSNAEMLKLAKQTVEKGAVWLPSPIVNDLIKRTSQKIESKYQPNLDELTQKEKEVAEKVAQGESNHEIAEEMKISERTVKSHLTQIYNKLNLRDRLHLMLYIRGAVN
ncbi:response regulator transcription factor [Thiomicrorhabdus sp. 6S3-12]|uniref:response regulator transcription factor n=1 Tax=Thiomicrorhabdus sp. 6S3-12 TaxID=2819681 RepID=UPI001AAC93C7|nr:response regulator transcription factor [Thiomicrorhabdus sp. 6S3-12]MBO1924601.1 response regulator transcription factor [Thiomicrorhabdus sp. 6S3-12]